MLGGEDHPLLAEPTGGKRLIVLITTDRPLAGPLNTNIVRFVARDIIDNPGDVAVVTVGRKGRDAMRRTGVPLEAHFATFGDRPTFADVLPLARLVTDDFLAGTYARVDIVYSHWVSTLVQRPTLLHDPADPAGGGHRGHPGQPVHLRAERRRPCSSSSSRATSRRACSRPCSRPRPARSRAGWSR